MNIPARQVRYHLVKQSQGFALQQREHLVQTPAAGEVVLRVRACSLNRRDVMVKKGFYPIGAKETLVPLSDGAGEVVAVGSGVTKFKEGDRAAAIFFQNWFTGRPTATTGTSALGGAVDGMLAQYVTLSAEGLVPLPKEMSFEEGAALPCAAVTAWHALVTRGHLRAGDTVLLQGTGGVSIFGLQFAFAAGAHPVITSSSDDKLLRARALGAAATINYKQVPDWSKAVVEATHGIGAHHILEVGGAGTLAQSLACVAPGGNVALIGGLSGFGGDIPTLSLVGRNASVTGIFVGSRSDFETMLQFMGQHAIRPVIDRRFAFEDAAAAFDYMDTGNHFGKLVINV